MARMYFVSNYGADGEGLVPSDTLDFHTLEQARAEVKKRLGDLAAWRKWDGIPDDDDIEAYHASREIGCGGCAISVEEFSEETSP